MIFHLLSTSLSNIARFSRKFFEHAPSGPSDMPWKSPRNVHIYVEHVMVMWENYKLELGMFHCPNKIYDFPL